MYKIIEEHWSKEGNHQQDDADCTYAVIDDKGQMIGMVTKLAKAKEIVGDNKYILC